MVWIVKYHLAISFHNVDISCSNQSTSPAVAVPWQLQDWCVWGWRSPQSGNSLLICFILLFRNYCKSKRSSLLMQSTNRFIKATNIINIDTGANCFVSWSAITEDWTWNCPVTRASLAAGPNTNFGHTGWIKSYQTEECKKAMACMYEHAVL